MIVASIREAREARRVVLPRERSERGTKGRPEVTRAMRARALEDDRRESS